MRDYFSKYTVHLQVEIKLQNFIRTFNNKHHLRKNLRLNHCRYSLNNNIAVAINQGIQCQQNLWMNLLLQACLLQACQACLFGEIQKLFWKFFSKQEQEKIAEQ
eukprot:TRINITY_DN6473_c0_g1_i3.p3 TRINITY_DN6473_c0_g1~~TRINITY_DN6473_c0_g1_i3.p3  ORF type:complete len:104 (-),score=0.80 TRINITY_DN6473_c0_g1_i3:453-764(-)